MDIVERIKQKSTEQSTNLSRLEKELDIGNGVIRRWNTRKPTAEQVHKVATRLNTTVEYLLTGKEAADLTPEESKLVDDFRASNQVGRKLIREHAATIRQQLPADQAPAGVSTCRIG